MKKFGKILGIILIVTMIMALTLALCACRQPASNDPDDKVIDNSPNDGNGGGQQTPNDGNGGDQQTPPGEENPDEDPLTPPSGKSKYTVTVRRRSGHAMSEINFLVSDKDNTPIKFATTDKEGKATFDMEEGAFSLVFPFLPEGFIAEDKYDFDGKEKNVEITFSTSLLLTSVDSDKTYKIGDVMNDFSFTDSTGKSSSLSEIFKTKKAVLLNFFYTTCSACIEEFPSLNKAYKNYSDKIEVLAIDPYTYHGATDTNAGIEKFRNSFKEPLEFPMIGNDISSAVALGIAFNAQLAPTSVLIDREGVICFWQEGAASQRQFEKLFDIYGAEDYTQKISFPGESIFDLKPDVEAPSSSAIEAAVNNKQSGFVSDYRFDESENNWPWLISQDGKSIYAANIGVDGSYAMMYTDIVLDGATCFAFDYKISCEAIYDQFAVFVDDVLTHVFSGEEDWQTCYAYVPVWGVGKTKHTIAMVYVKDSTGGAAGDDTVYVKNMRYETISQTSEPFSVLYRCAYGAEEGATSYSDYITPVYNEDDGYYHVDTKDGPLVLADLLNGTAWSSTPVYLYYLDMKEENRAQYDVLFKYIQYVTPSREPGRAAVTQELYENLNKFVYEVDKKATANTWLEVCSYHKVYNSNKQLKDPIIGLAQHTAYDTVINDLINNPDSERTPNHAVIDVFKVPRGIWYKFVPDENAVYHIYSVNHDDTEDGIVDSYCWIADENGVIFDERDDNDNFRGSLEQTSNFSIIRRFEAGKTYYILCDFNFPGTLDEYDFYIDKIAYSGQVWAHAGMDYVGGEPDKDGNFTAIGLKDAVDYALDKDGVYRVKNADGSLGSVIYIDMTATTAIFPNETVEEMLDISSYYCKLCGSVYPLSVAKFEALEEFFCPVCHKAKSKDDFKKIKTFELPERVERDEDGNLMVVAYDITFEGYDEIVKIYVPVYGLSVDYTNLESYMGRLEALKDSEYGGIVFKDYTDIVAHYVELSKTNYPQEEELVYSGPHKGCVAATEELVEILQKFILFGDHAMVLDMKNAWLRLAWYYQQFSEAE